ncbi:MULTISPECIES: alkaline phosphatase PhoX [unclassified Leptolyngbya]|uniref:alkaline phosphatase PhoX n=1 Tax=unclassified Leptolyngbya TaxID=2650499 RepID=UPI001684BBAB|nr:DUF839 domain-containing protein [Leptolyngbya sp. FACHB-8]MBD2158669.1 DUF839 domain-containing protein [Leptolyngbya sp. FACHB-16]
MAISRRQFLALSGLSAMGAIAHPLYSCSATPSTGFGALQRDPETLLELPSGFRYRVISTEGQTMNDGYRVPGAFDGMAAFPGPDGSTILVRNHELMPGALNGVQGTTPQKYDERGAGGTTTLVVSGDRQLLRQYTSLAGTVRNCAGGPTPWNSWLSCEETVYVPEVVRDGVRVSKRHGYVFEVPAAATGPVNPEPIVALGRFNHEAIAVDPRTGILYQTEDRGDGLFYRFIPNERGNLQAGGVLEALMVSDRPQLRTHQKFPVQEPVAVSWVPIDEVDPADDTVRVEGFRKGAAQFSRGEGICYHDGHFYITCTSGGDIPNGQVWRYTPGASHQDGGTLELFVQPNNPQKLDYPDNLTMSPWGDLIVCEDGRGEQRLIGITPTGDLYPLARNVRNQSEFAGICFAPDGQTMFVNIYAPGITFAIWREGGMG